jgi:hypothetical protein
MKLKIALIGAAAIAAAALSACGDHNSEASMPTPTPTPTTQQLDTAQVLALAQKTSEVSTPFEVDAGMLTLTDTSDSAEAISVNGM